MRYRGRLPWLIAVLLAAGAGRIAGASTLDLFEKANGAYEQGRYDEAAGDYESILKDGVRDPRVNYNLGNAYFKMGRLGLAILNYERALRLDPSDVDARDNLEFALGRIRDRVPEPESPYPIRALQGRLDAIPSNPMTLIFLGAYLVVGGIAGALLLARDETRRHLLGYALLGGSLVLLIVGGGLAYRVRQDNAKQAIVMQDRVDVLSGPAADNTVLFTVHEGTRLEVRNRLDGWCQVSLPNSLSGWVPAASVEEV